MLRSGLSGLAMPRPAETRHDLAAACLMLCASLGVAWAWPGRGLGVT